MANARRPPPDCAAGSLISPTAYRNRRLGCNARKVGLTDSAARTGALKRPEAESSRKLYMPRLPDWVRVPTKTSRLRPTLDLRFFVIVHLQ